MNPMNNNWGMPAMQDQQANKGVFATFVDGEQAVKNYLVPAGGMAILIDLNGNKMWFKSININGVPAPIRSFDIKEKPLPIPAGANVVSRTEFDSLNQQFAELSQQISQILKAVNQAPAESGGNAK